MNSKSVMKGMIGFYIALFFLYLFGPLAVMSVTAFNTPNYPTAEEILANPASDFVASFIGADRGKRALSIREVDGERVLVDADGNVAGRLTEPGAA